MSTSHQTPAHYLRVSDVLSAFGKYDAIPKDVLEAAIQRGNEVHECAKLYALSLLIEKPSESIKNYFIQYKKWFDEYVVEVVLAEKRLYHHTMLLTGEPDLVVKLRGDDFYSLIDIKTPLLVAKTWRLQTAAYSLLLRECEGIEIARRIIVGFKPETTDIKITEFLDHDKDEQMFLRALAIHRYLN